MIAIRMQADITATRLIGCDMMRIWRFSSNGECTFQPNDHIVFHAVMELDCGITLP